MDLHQLRQQIDQIDQELVTKLNQRVELARAVAREKDKNGLPIYHPEREAKVFDKIARMNPGPLSEENLQHIYREIISAMIALEKPLTISFLGPEATFTEQAARLCFGSSLRYQAAPSIPDVFRAVDRQEADYGVVPIENSTGGTVIHSLDMLAETELKITNQIYLPIEHCLLSNCELRDIKVIYSKDQAFLQARVWLTRHVPHAEQVEVDSTVHAVQRATREEGAAAIASSLAAERYGLAICAERIQDRQDNETRFLVIGRHASEALGEGRDKTSLVFSIRDAVGTLERALGAFSSRGLNLTKIESRPSQRRAWDYVFFVDLIGHWQDENVQAAVQDLRERCPMVRWLGSYPESRR